MTIVTEQTQHDAEAVKAVVSRLGIELYPWQERVIDLLFDPECSEIVISRLSGRHGLPREHAHPRFAGGWHGAGEVDGSGDGVGAVDVADSASPGEPPAVTGG